MSQKHYPEGVFNKEAWDEYLEVASNELFHDERFQSTSQDGLQVDLMGLSPRVKSILEESDLPQEEREALWILHKQALHLKGRLVGLRNKALRDPKKKFVVSNESLLSPKSTELIEMFGQFHTINEVHKVVVMEWGIEVTQNTIANFRKKHLDKITELQEIHKRDYSSVRLAHKKSRLLELSELYVGRKSLYDKHNRREDYTLLLNTLKQIEHEVDGDQIMVNGQIVHNIEHTISSHIHKELLKDVSILEIVIGKVAAKTNVAPEYLVAKLTKGLYSKFSGFAMPDNQDLSQNEITYPSQMVYDIDWLKQRQDKIKKDSKELMSSHSVKVSDEQLDVASIVRQKLIERSRTKQEQLNEIRDRMDSGNDDGIV